MVVGANPLLGHPALAPWCRVVEADGRLLLEHGDTVVTFEGDAARDALPALLPLLDGTRSRADIEAFLGNPTARLIEPFLRLLSEHALLVDGQRDFNASPLAATASYVEAVGGLSREPSIAQAIADANVSVLGSSRTADEIHRLLQDAGVGAVRAAPWDGLSRSSSFVVVAPTPEERGKLEGLNERQLSRRAAWLQVLPYDGRRVVVGPLFLAGISACHRCYQLRRAACSGYEDDYDAIDRVPMRTVSPPPLDAIAAGLASLLTVRWLGTRDPAFPGRLYVLEASSVLGLTRHRTLRVPRCPVCGPPERALPSPWFDERP